VKSHVDGRFALSQTTATELALQTWTADQHSRQTAPSPALSVIICTYNRRDMVLAALTSLRRQSLTGSDFEVIVVDNGSTDGTLDALHSYQHSDKMNIRQDGIWQAQYLQEPQNGLAYARNLGVQAATGEILVFLDDDALAAPDLLEQLLRAYEETEADVLACCVELRWEASRPYWLSNDLLEMLGHFVPFRTRCMLPDSIPLNNACFSLKREALQQAGGFSPFLSKRLHAPVNGEMADLCQRLREVGYEIWYEPSAIVRHRITRPRLERAFIVGRAYWQGRSEILSEYVWQTRIEDETGEDETAAELSNNQRRWQIVRAILPDLGQFVGLTLLQRPLIFLMSGTSNQHLQATLLQAYHWGRVQQQLALANQPPLRKTPPEMLLLRAEELTVSRAASQAQPQYSPPDREEERATIVYAPTPDSVPEGKAPLDRPSAPGDEHPTTYTSQLSLSWLWRHRMQRGLVRGIIHCYRPGAFDLTIWKRALLLLKLRLARWLGLRIVSTDAGGWWQSGCTLSGRGRRVFEYRVLRHSHLVLAYTQYPELLYPQEKLQQRTHSLAHPGLRGLLADLPENTLAREHLGLPEKGFVYLCLAHQHTERELLQLIATFAKINRVQTLPENEEEPADPESASPQLLIAGIPGDKPEARKLIRSAALVSDVHLSMGKQLNTELAWYIGAADALVHPHTARRRAGSIDMAMLFHSYGRLVIAPNLPRFRGMLPSHACIFYDPAQQETLGNALLHAPEHTYHLTRKEVAALEMKPGWEQSTEHILKWLETGSDNQKRACETGSW
jgi:GT2 family glycosyltransferase